MSSWEIVAAIFGLVGVYLTVRENIWCWPVGLVNVGLYIYVFWQAKLYADMGLQAVYVVLCLYGWWAWLHGGKDHDELPVGKTPAWAWWVSIAGGIAASWALGTFLYAKTDDALPYWDAGTTAFSLVAQWLQTRKWIENWWVWIVVDAIYVPIYLVKGLWATAVLYGVFLVLAVLGDRAWRRSLAARAAG